jgi:acyl carrier protein
MAGQGARHLVLLGRREAGLAAQAALERLRGQGVNLMLAQADVAEVADLDRVFTSIEATMPPLRGIVHAAGVLGDCQTIATLAPEALWPVLRPKLLGAWRLHQMSSRHALDWFICFSSVASAWGSKGQAHYAAANQFLDTLAHYRISLGLPALTLNWGPWEEGGMATAEVRGQLQTMGLRAWPAATALEALQTQWGSPHGQIILADLDWHRFKDLYEARRRRPLLADWPIATSGKALPEVGDGPAASLVRLTPKERLEWLIGLVRQEASAVLGLPNADHLDIHKGFFRLGLDSLMAVELKNRLAKALQANLSATLAFDYPTVSALAVYLGETILDLDLASASPAAGFPKSEEEDRQASPPDDPVFLSGDELQTSIASQLERLESLLRED